MQKMKVFRDGGYGNRPVYMSSGGVDEVAIAAPSQMQALLSSNKQGRIIFGAFDNSTNVFAVAAKQFEECKYALEWYKDNAQNKWCQWDGLIPWVVEEIAKMGYKVELIGTCEPPEITRESLYVWPDGKVRVYRISWD